MSLGKIIRAILIGLVSFGLLYLVAAQFLGPGVTDGSFPISNDYEYNDSGGYEKNIIYSGNERTKEIIVDSRVDDYILGGDKIFVARRPRESYLAADDALRSELSDICEYWVINVKTHKVMQTADIEGLHCNPP